MRLSVFVSALSYSFLVSFVPVVAHEPPAGCSAFIEDWDPLAAGAGLSLTNCGVELQADTGSFEVAHGKVTLVPGESDELGLGDPIALAGTASTAAQASPPAGYRVRFGFVGHGEIVTAAFFVRVRYRFDEELGAIDALTFSAMGTNFTFNSQGHDNQSDHLHADIRGACLQEGSVEGADMVNYSGFLMETEVEYTMAMDVEGNAEVGPLTLAMKLFKSGDPEPAGPFAMFLLPVGLGPIGEDATEHLFLAAALGGGSLDILDLSLCEIPGDERRARNLACGRDGEEFVRMTWENPITADPTVPISILVAGVEEASIPGDSTEYVFARELEGGVTCSVVNSSGFAASCTLEIETPEAHFLRSDCNGSRTVDLSDAVFTLSYLFTGGSPPACIDACNSNGDGLSDLSDAVYTLGYLFLGAPAPVAPFPACGHGEVKLGCDVEQCPH